MTEFVSRSVDHPPLTTSAAWQKGDPVGYPRDQKRVGSAAFPVPVGSSYRRTVPDTLDLAERASKGLIGLTESTDPACDYSMYFRVFWTNPPVMMHDASDICNAKLMESRPLLRQICGDRSRIHVDAAQLTSYLRKIGDDGLMWEPIAGQPWMKLGLDASGVARHDDLVERYCAASMNGRFLGAVALNYLLTGDVGWKQAGEGLVTGLATLAVYRDDFAFFERSYYPPGVAPDQEAPTAKSWQALSSAWIIQGLVQFYRSTGFDPAIDLAAKLVRHQYAHSECFTAGGEWLPGTGYNHHHGHALQVLAMVEYATCVGDRELLQFAETCYRQGRQLGNAEIGYFPEWFYTPGSEVYDKPDSTCEGCEVADMIAIALKLSRAGAGDYWDDADRYLRNHFAEMQLLDGAWVHEYTKSLQATDVRPHETAERVVERNIGAFGGWASPNQWWESEKVTPGKAGIMHCCTDNATRAIYYGWESVVTTADRLLTVNLLLNHTSAWADIDSYLPYEGRIDIHAKRSFRLQVRIPEWASPAATICRVGGTERRGTFDGRYDELGSIKAGETAVVSFPIGEREVVREIASSTYRLTIRGSEVVHIDPPGKLCPLYQREHYRSSRARLVDVQRFVPDEVVAW